MRRSCSHPAISVPRPNMLSVFSSSVLCRVVHNKHSVRYATYTQTQKIEYFADQTDIFLIWNQARCMLCNEIRQADQNKPLGYSYVMTNLQSLLKCGECIQILGTTSYLIYFISLLFFVILRFALARQRIGYICFLIQISRWLKTWDSNPRSFICMIFVHE